MDNRKEPAKNSSQNNFQENLLLAKNVLAEVKKEVTCSNDIISDKDLPHLYEHEMEIYKLKFGAEKLQHYLDYQNKLSLIRNLTNSIVNEHKLSFPISTQQIATSLMGVGECSENASIALMKLRLAGCTAPILNVVIASSADSRSKKHNFLLIGDYSAISQQIQSFSSLDNSCILLDPFFNIVGQANKITPLLGWYLDLYKLDFIENAVVSDPKLNVGLLQKNAEFVAQKVRTKLSVKVSNPCITSTKETLFTSKPTSTPKKTPQAELIQICNACPTLTKIDVAKDIGKNDFSAVFRKACAYGIVEVVKKLIEHKDILSVDINGTSSNGLTALDWINDEASIQKKKIKPSAQKQIKDIIIAAGALSSKDIKRPGLN